MLTIHQSIPLQGIANVVISVEVSRLNEELDDLLDGLRRISGVRRVQMIGQG
ncbi:ACT domain-containing protein [Paenibacillus sp. JCM 10914]|nr:ACT domain-containing protein [Paenibacillus sp. JCM 10914]